MLQPSLRSGVAVLIAALVGAGCVEADPTDGASTVAEAVTVPSIEWAWSPAWQALLTSDVVAQPTWDPAWGADLRAGSPAAVANQDDARHLVYFYRNRSDQLVVWDPSHLASTRAYDDHVLTAPSAAAHDGVIDVVYMVGTPSAFRIVHRRWGADGWMTLAGGATSETLPTRADALLSAPHIAATSKVRILRRVVSYDTELDVFYLRAGGAPARLYRAGETGTWQPDGLFFPEYPLVAAASAASSSPNTLEVVYTRADGVVRHLTANVAGACGADGCWTLPEDVMGGAVGAATVSAYAGSFDVFAPIALPSRTGPPTTFIAQRPFAFAHGWQPVQTVVGCPHPTPPDQAVAISLGEQLTGASVVASSTRIDLVMHGLDGNLWTDEEGFTVPGAGGQAPPCGTCAVAGASCCGGTCESPDLACDATDHCAACGGAGQPCCAVARCGAGLGCDDDSNTCGCGGRDQPCCATGPACATGLACGAFDNVCGAGFTATYDILRTSCTQGCHGHAWDKAMAEYPVGARRSERDAATAIGAAGLLMPGPATASPLYQRATSVSTVSPLGMAPYLPAATRTAMQAEIAKWIDGGAVAPPPK